MSIIRWGAGKYGIVLTTIVHLGPLAHIPIPIHPVIAIAAVTVLATSVETLVATPSPILLQAPTSTYGLVWTYLDSLSFAWVKQLLQLCQNLGNGC
jgi:hypothetical protein